MTRGSDIHGGPHPSGKMSGVVLPGNRTLAWRESEIPVPTGQQVLIEMKASSLCGSDLRAIYRPSDQGHGPEAYRGGVAGHEPCGIIAATGPDAGVFKTGDRVVVYHIGGCGVCLACRRGYMISCSDPVRRRAYGWQRDGGHAPYLLADAAHLVKLPDALSYVDGALVACGFGTAYSACLRAAVSGCDRVLVTGLGPVGLGVAMLARAMGAAVVGVESVPERRELARSLGFADLVSPSDTALDELRSLSGDHGFEVTIDCSGAEAARHLCLEAAREWGRVVFVGEGGTAAFAPSPLLIHKQLTLHGSWVCSLGEMMSLVELLERWQLHPEATVTHRFRLDQAQAAYELFDTGKTGKVVITWGDEPGNDGVGSGPVLQPDS